MGKRQQTTWRDWGMTFRRMLRKKESSLAKVAETMDVAESTVRSWTNGTREINLIDFGRLCEAADIDPAVVLAYQGDEGFGRVEAAWREADETGRELLTIAAGGAEQHARRSKARKNNPPSNPH